MGDHKPVKIHIISTPVHVSLLFLGGSCRIKGRSLIVHQTCPITPLSCQNAAYILSCKSIWSANPVPSSEKLHYCLHHNPKCKGPWESIRNGLQLHEKWPNDLAYPNIWLTRISNPSRHTRKQRPQDCNTTMYSMKMAPFITITLYQKRARRCQ